MIVSATSNTTMVAARGSRAAARGRCRGHSQLRTVDKGGQVWGEAQGRGARGRSIGISISYRRYVKLLFQYW